MSHSDALERATLLPLDHQIDAELDTERSLHVWIGSHPVDAGLTVRRGVLEQRYLTSVHTGQVELDVMNTTYRRMRLTTDSPFLDLEQQGSLNDEGFVRIGRRVHEGDVLISAVAVDVFARPKSKTLQTVRDRSEYVPVGWDGAVVAAVHRYGRRELGRKSPRELKERVEIVLRLEQEKLAVGDLLIAQSQILGIVAHFAADQQMPSVGGVIADLIVPQEVGRKLCLNEGMHELGVGKSVDLGWFASEARAMGPCSLISQQPLGGRLHATLKTPVTPQPAIVTPSHVRWLREHGLEEILGELTSLKSDDVLGRAAMRNWDRHKPHATIPEAGTPNSLYILRGELMSLGLSVTCLGGEHVTIALKPATREELLSCSSGCINKPNTIHYRTLKREPEGILCPNVFGDAYRFGHIELPVPVVPYLWRCGSPSLLEQILRLSEVEIDQLVCCNLFLRHAGSEYEWRQSEGTLPEPDAGWMTGAEAIASLLTEISPADLPSGIADRAQSLVQDVLLIPPVFMRPLILLDSGNFATSDVNDLYRQLINRRNRLRKLMELNAPHVIVLNDIRELQHSADALWANCLLPEDAQVYGDSPRPLVDLTNLVLKRLVGLTGKRVDWSAHARVVADSELGEAEVLLPRRIFDRLGLHAGAVLMTSPHGASFAAARPAPTEGNVIRLAPRLFAQLELGDTDVPLCDIHRPLGREAICETEQLMERVPSQQCTLKSRPLIDVVDFNEAVTQLISASVSGDPISLDSPRGLLVGGLGVVKFADTEYPPGKPPDPVKEVLVPPEPPRIYPDVRNRQIHDIIQNYQRKSCVFTVRRSVGPLPVGAGRIGGSPCLPADIDWPKASAKPLPFLAQLPLDVLRSLGGNVPAFPLGSLLTIFGARDWWSLQPATGLSPVFIVSGPSLQERTAPGDDLCIPRFALESEVVVEVPCWSEMSEILDVELDGPDPDVLQQFYETQWAEYPAAREATKVGGWPHWVQAPESEDRLVAQLNSEHEANLALGDGGSLYVCQREDGGLSVFMQCY